MFAPPETVLTLETAAVAFTFRWIQARQGEIFTVIRMTLGWLETSHHDWHFCFVEVCLLKALTNVQNLRL